MYRYLFITSIVIVTGLVSWLILSVTVTSIQNKRIRERLGIPHLKIPARAKDIGIADKKVYIGALIGAITGLILTAGSTFMAGGALIGAVSIVVVTVALEHVIARQKNDIRRSECFSLFRAVEFYMKAGLPLHYALAESRVFLRELVPAVNKALIYWPTGSAEALEILKKEINLPEGDTLVLLLHQINRSGLQGFEKVLSSEIDRMEELQAAKEAERISTKPLLLVLYRGLPLLAVFGLIAGTMWFHLAETLEEAGLGTFF